MTDKIRLQKFLAQCGIASRRKAEDFSAAGRVTVNKQKITEFGVKIDPVADRICVDGKRVTVEEQGVLIFNKPPSVITTRLDTHGRKTVVDYMPEEFSTYFPVGRLDRDTTGLLIMTNDGELADLMLHPRYEIPRTYVAEVDGHLAAETLEKIEAGFSLEDGPVRANVKVLNQKTKATLVELTLHIGRKRIVRRMMKALGHPVLKLKRTVHGPFFLGNLPEGELLVFPDSKYEKLKEKIQQQVS